MTAVLDFIAHQPLPRHFDDRDDAATEREAEENRLARCALYRDDMRRALLTDASMVVLTPAFPQRYTPALDVVDDIVAESGSTLLRDALEALRYAANGDAESAQIQARTLFARVAEAHARRQAGVRS